MNTNRTIGAQKMVPGTVYSISIPAMRRRRKLTMQKIFSFSLVAIIPIIIAILPLQIKSDAVEEKVDTRVYDELGFGHDIVVVEEPELPNDPNVNFEEGPICNILLSSPIRNTEVTYLDPWENISLDLDIKTYIYESAREADIPGEILFSMAWRESRFSPNAESETGDHGLFQINEYNFEFLAKKLGLSVSELSASITDPYVNTDCAIIMIKECRDNYTNSTWHQVLMRYNMGPGGARACFDAGEYTSAYSRSIMEYAEENFGFTDVELK